MMCNYAHHSKCEDVVFDFMCLGCEQARQMELMDEIERLRAEIAWHEEENHRLRAALHKIAEWDLTGTAISALGEKE